MRVNLSWIFVPLVAAFLGWHIWSDFSIGDWTGAAADIAMALVFTGLCVRRIWGKYLVYLASGMGVLWVAYRISLEIISGRLFIRKGGLAIASDIGTVPAALLYLLFLAGVLFLSIGMTLVAHDQCKKMEQDRLAGDDKGNPSSPPSHTSES
jgi:hypothetical protein